MDLCTGWWRRECPCCERASQRVRVTAKWLGAGGGMVRVECQGTLVMLVQRLSPLTACGLRHRWSHPSRQEPSACVLDAHPCRSAGSSLWPRVRELSWEPCRRRWQRVGGSPDPRARSARCATPAEPPSLDSPSLGTEWGWGWPLGGLAQVLVGPGPGLRDVCHQPGT